MDADYLMQVVKAKDGNNETVKDYMLNSGMTSSALEHSVPEQLFSTPGNAAEGISAVKALQIANDQGIPIYTVNQTNISTVLPQLQVDIQVKEDIQNAVNAGKEVTVSKTNISFNGWTGCGYIVINPETGAGAYMLSGGTNGAILLVALMLLTAIALLAIAVAIGPIAVVVVSLLMPVYLAILAWLAGTANESQRKCAQAIVLSVGLFLKAIWDFTMTPLSLTRLTITVNGALDRVGRECYGQGVAQ